MLFQHWGWSSDNSLFVSCDQENVFVGSSDGIFGLSLDSSLAKGHTERCRTFNNDPLTEPKDFDIITVEIWTFQEE